MTGAPSKWPTRLLSAVAAIAAAGVGGYGARHLLEPAPRLVAEPSPRASAPGQSSVPERAHRSISDTLPDIAFPDRSGKLRHFTHWKGRPLLVNFWAPWCSPCRKEIPLLEQLSRTAAGRLQVIGVAVDARPAVLRYARHAGIRYPLLIGLHRGLETIRALGMEAVFPFSVFVDAKGRIVTLKIGILSRPQARLILDRIEALDRGQIDLGTARSEIAAGIESLAVAHARKTGSDERAHRSLPSPIRTIRYNFRPSLLKLR